MRQSRSILTLAILALVVGCARPDWIQQTLVTVDVTGVWVGTTGAAEGTSVQLELEQQGAKVKGMLRAAGAATPGPWGRTSGPIDGSVAGDAFSFRQTNSLLTGELTVAGDEMTGSVKTNNIFPISLHRTSSSPPASSRP